MTMRAMIVILGLLSIQFQAIGQDDLWKGDSIDHRLGVNNGLRKIYVQFSARDGQVPLLRVRSRLVDAENLKGEVFADLVPRGSYVYQGAARVDRRSNDYLEHRFQVAGGRSCALALDIKAIAPSTLRELAFIGWDVAPDNLPHALLTITEGTRVFTYPLRDLGKWKDREEEALLFDEVPMEKTANRIDALRFSVQKLLTAEDRQRRLQALKQIAFYDDEELDRAGGILLQLREDKDEEVAKAVRAFCIERNLYSQQELMQHLYFFRLDREADWLKALDLLDKIPAKDAARDGAPALKHFLRDRKPAPEIAARAEARLEIFRKLVPPGTEDAPLPDVSAETGWIPIMQPLRPSGDGRMGEPGEPKPESRPSDPPASRPADEDDAKKPPTRALNGR